MINALQEELPACVAAADGTEVKDGEHLQWWHRHKSCLPNWSDAVKQLVLVQPSSAPAERAFSLLRAAFDERQTKALEDNLEAAVMMAYNHKAEDQ